MIWALLAILGVPIWLVVGALLSAIVSGRRFRAQEGVFALAFREHGNDSWRRGGAHGRYVHNVLIVNHGLALVRTSIHVVERIEPLELGAPPKKLDDPVAWALTLDDDQRVDIAVSAGDEPLLSLA